MKDGAMGLDQNFSTISLYLRMSAFGRMQTCLLTTQSGHSHEKEKWACCEVVKLVFLQICL